MGSMSHWYTEATKPMLAQVGFGRVLDRMAKKLLPALLANVRILTFHYRQILKSLWGETDYHTQISRGKGSKKKTWILVT